MTQIFRPDLFPCTSLLDSPLLAFLELRSQAPCFLLSFWPAYASSLWAQWSSHVQTFAVETPHPPQFSELNSTAKSCTSWLPTVQIYTSHIKHRQKSQEVKKHSLSAGLRWCTLLIPAFGRHRQQISEFEANLVYRVSSRAPRATQRNPLSTTQNSKTNQTNVKTKTKNYLSG